MVQVKLVAKNGSHEMTKDILYVVASLAAFTYSSSFADVPAVSHWNGKSPIPELGADGGSGMTDIVAADIARWSMRVQV